MRLMMLCVLLACLATLDSPRELEACGGASYGDFAPLLPVDHTVELIVHPESEWAAWGNWERDELRFLYPLKQAHPAELGPLWDFAHAGGGPPARRSFAAFESAVKAGKLADAEVEARAIVASIYALPPVWAAERRADLETAVEFLELRPRLGGVPKDVVGAYFGGGPLPAKLPPVLRAASEVRSGKRPSPKGHPRAGSLEWAELVRDFEKRVPNGWSDAIQKEVPAATWKELGAAVDRFVARYPMHPLRDEARLWKIRIHYFSGDYAAAWAQAFALYADRRVRALAEMRYLLVMGHPPPRAQLDALKDPLLVTALTSEASLDAERFERRWALAEASPDTAWAENLRVRLLAWAARHAAPGALPKAFPDQVLRRSALAGKLRAAALMKAQRYDDAKAQLAALPVDAEQARLLAQLHALRGEWAAAAEVIELNDDGRRYLIRVLVEDAPLAKLARSKLPKVRQDALIELAARAARRGKWAEAVRHLHAAGRADAALVRKLGKLGQSRSGDAELELARFLDAHVGELFFEADPGFYRGMSLREERAGPSEKARIAAALLRSHERALALEAYTRWLSKHSADPRAKTVLAEADRAYVRLTNWGGSDGFFFGRWQKTSKTVAELRRVGKLVRQRP